jgi:hypothetical protein
VEEPDDVTELGIKISRALGRCEDGDATAGPAQTRLCFDSVTALLRHVDEQRAFKFLHLLTERVERAGVVGHFHLDADACDDRTVGTLSPLFDVVLDHSAES